MRARILWAATLAFLLFGLAVGPSAGSGAAGRPVIPSSNWSVVASMPQDIYGAATASNGVFSYAVGGYSTSTGTTLDTFNRYNPVNERWETPAGDARRGRDGLGGLRTRPRTGSTCSAASIRTRASFSDATRYFDLTTGMWDTAANMPAPRAFMASGYNAANGKIYLVGGNDSADPASAKATTWEYDPAANTFTTRAPIPHAVGGSAFGVIGGHLYLAGGLDALGDGGGPGLGLHHRREQLGGQGRHAEPDERRRQRRRERQALELRRRERFRPDRRRPRPTTR